MKIETAIAIFGVSIFCLGFGMFAYEDNRDMRFETIALEAAKHNCMPEISPNNTCFNINNQGQISRICLGQQPAK